MNLFGALTPIVLLGLTPLVLMLVISFRRGHGLTVVLSLAGLALTLAVLPGAGGDAGPPVAPLLAMDAYALFYIGLLSAATMVVVVMSYGYLERMPGNREEFYLLLTLATFGCAVLAASNHFVSFFLGLEILSVSLYGLVAYLRTTRTALESGIKYLILAAASAAFLLFGMALIYADLGTMDFTAMASMLSGKTREPTLLLLGGFGMVVIGAGFKLAVVPFHMWAPDVYQGAPTPVTAYLTTVSKGAMVALLLRYGRYGGLLDYDSVVTVLGIIAVASMFLGNLLAFVSGEHQAPAGLFLHRPSRLPAGGGGRSFSGGIPCGDVLPGGLFHHLTGHFRHHHRAFGRAQGGRRGQRLPRPLLAPPLGEWRTDAHAVLPGRDPAHRRFRGQVLRPHRRRAVRSLDPRDPAGGQQRHRPLLLPAHHHHDVPAGARGPILAPAGHATLLPPRRTGARGSHGAAHLVRRVPRAAAGRDSGGRGQPRLRNGGGRYPVGATGGRPYMRRLSSPVSPPSPPRSRLLGPRHQWGGWSAGASPYRAGWAASRKSEDGTAGFPLSASRETGGWWGS